MCADKIGYLCNLENCTSGSHGELERDKYSILQVTKTSPFE